MVRLQKFLAEAGVASRRASEEIIQAGRVTVNATTVTELGTKIDPTRDYVSVDGRPVKPRRKVYIALNKPRGYVGWHSTEENRDSVLGLLPDEWSDLQVVGRLDFNAEGLIFLTNDGDFCLKLTHPRYAIPKTYVAKVQGRVTPEHLKNFTEGVYDAGDKLKARAARLVSAGDSNSVVELELTEVKNREATRIFESQNLTVRRMERVKIGPIAIGELKPGKWRKLTENEVKSLLQSV